MTLERSLLYGYNVLTQESHMDSRQIGQGLVALIVLNLTAAALYSQNVAPTTPVADSKPTTAEVTGVRPQQSSELVDLTNAVKQRNDQIAQDSSAEMAATKEALLASYQKTLAQLAAASTANQQQSKWDVQIQSAPNLLQSLREADERLDSPPAPQLVDSFINLDQAQSTVQGLEAQLAAATKATKTLRDEQSRREQRRKTLPQEISALTTELEATRNLPPPEDEDPLQKEAQVWARRAAILSLQSQVQQLESELRAYEAEASLLPLQLQQAADAEKEIQESLRIAADQLDTMRSSRIFNEQKEVAALSKETDSPILKQQVDELLTRIRRWHELNSKRKTLQTEIEAAKTTFSMWNDRRNKMESRANPDNSTDGVGSFNSFVGMMLRKQQNELPDTRSLEIENTKHRRMVQEINAQLFELEDELATVNQRQLEIDRQHSAQVASGSVVALKDSELEEQAILAKRKEVALAMTADINAYLDDLLSAANVNEETIALTKDYRGFINRHILWIRSLERFTLRDLSAAGLGFAWLSSFEYWSMVGKQLIADAITSPHWYALFGVIFVLLLLKQSYLRRRLASISAKAAKKNCVDFSITVHGLILTLLITLPASLILLFLWWRLTATADVQTSSDQAFIDALATGIFSGVMVYLPMEFLRQVCRIDGLATKHFDWSNRTAQRLRINLRWLIDISVPLVVVLTMVADQNDSRLESSLGRIAFLILMPLLSIFFGRIFHPRAGIPSHYLEKYRGRWLDRLSFLWYPALVLFPIGLAITCFLGYHFTALQIARDMNTTFWAALALVIIYSMLTRWLVLKRRQLILDKARERLEVAARRSAGEDTPAFAETVDVVDLSEQTKRLVSSLVIVAALLCAYSIWSEIVPAVALLDDVHLWTVQGATDDQDVEFTLANFVFVIPAFALMLIAGHNVPGLMEIAFLQHLPLTNAAKYAITTLCRYAIYAVGLIVVAYTIGLQWSSIQWLVAALGVGLGFGLQEIFANFVSGVILLFEQPLRVGDTITVDGTTGTVSKIRMRATTIINWDRQELIVPNKDLITGKLLNWTLSDTTNRLVLNVGVAYGTDIQEACKIVEAICLEHPDVLRDPLPMITFSGFGDNTLNIVVRAYLESLNNRLATTHQLHQLIYSAFADAGIEIAFPQRDLHIRSLPDKFSQILAERTPSQSPLQ